MDVGEQARHAAVRWALTFMILLDTNALIWLDQGHRRTRLLAKEARRLHVSPASVLELQYLLETGRIRLRAASLAEFIERGPWTLDDPPSGAWFTRALDIGWTRDPFDRLIVAHARLRGWRVATADTMMVEHLSTAERFDF